MNMPSDDDLFLIRRSVLLQLLIRVIEKQSQEIEKSKSSMERLYVAAARKLASEAQDDLIAIKREKFGRKIKVRENSKEDFAIHYGYTVGGFSAQVGMYQRDVSNELGGLLAGYIGRMYKVIFGKCLSRFADSLCWLSICGRCEIMEIRDIENKVLEILKSGKVSIEDIELMSSLCKCSTVQVELALHILKYKKMLPSTIESSEVI